MAMGKRRRRERLRNPDEVEHGIREVERRIRRKWNIGSWDRERSSVA